MDVENRTPVIPTPDYPRLAALGAFGCTMFAASCVMWTIDRQRSMPGTWPKNFSIASPGMSWLDFVLHPYRGAG